MKPVDRGLSVSLNRPPAPLSRLMKATLHAQSLGMKLTSLIEAKTAVAAENRANIFIAGDDLAKSFVNGIQKAEINNCPCNVLGPYRNHSLRLERSKEKEEWWRPDVDCVYAQVG